MGQKVSHPNTKGNPPSYKVSQEVDKICEIFKSTKTSAPKYAKKWTKRLAKLGYTDSDLPFEKESLRSIWKKIDKNLDDIALDKFFTNQWLYCPVDNRTPRSNFPLSVDLPYRHTKDPLLGQGTLGMTKKVFVYQDQSKVFTLKKIYIKDAEHLSRLVPCLEILQLAAHPNILKIQTYFTINNRVLCFLSDLCDMNLFAFLGEEAPKPAEWFNSLTLERKCHQWAKWMTDLLSALEYLHGLEVIHGAIKMENVLIKGRQIYLADPMFDAQSVGLASTENSGAKERTTSWRQTDEPTEESDIFSMGGIFLVGIISIWNRDEIQDCIDELRQMDNDEHLFEYLAAGLDVERFKPLNKVAALIKDKMVGDSHSAANELVPEFEKIAESLGGDRVEGT
jgi:hypothetical protein